ncbi:MAG: phytanoyl-CoA dioxygenase family protein [Candidatus Binatia bacterium]|nr:phytanoyl-CoA dioxygenase family protein [Candidatus Binatia bacterium]
MDIDDDNDGSFDDQDCAPTDRGALVQGSRSELTGPMAPKIRRFQASETKETVLEVLQEDGVVVVEGLLEPGLRDQINRDFDPYMANAALTTPDLNDLSQAFYGDKTRRIGALPAKSRAFCDVLTNPLLLGVCDEILLPACSSYQMNVGQVLEVGPGAVCQMLHRDEDVWVHVPRPAPMFQVATMTALVDFTGETGATRIVPGSHTWDPQRQAEEHDVAIAEMPAGSVAIYLGRTLHGAGTNRTADQWRRGIHLSYLVGWLRTEENNYLGVPPEVARDLPEQAQELLGYAMHDAIEAGGGVAGFVEMRDPMKMLRASKEQAA